MKKLILYLSIPLLFVGCQGLAVKEKIIDNYFLVAADASEWTSLSYHEDNEGANYSSLIEATVFAVGYNDNYMIVKQHPCTLPNPPDKNITNFYILPLKEGMNWRTKNGLMGPLTEQEFNAKRKELGIPKDLTFTKLLKNLE